jgi:hypothetical protein
MMSTGEHEERAKGHPSGKEGKASPPPTDKVPEMPPEEWRNAGLNLLMLLAQAYYKLLELVSVRYYKDEDGYVRFTTAGGGQRITDEKLQEFNTTYLGIPKEAVTKQQFDLDKLRDLCFRRFVDRLYMVRFSDPSGKVVSGSALKIRNRDEVIGRLCLVAPA